MQKCGSNPTGGQSRMAERFKAPVLKTEVPFLGYGFKSRSALF